MPTLSRSFHSVSLNTLSIAGVLPSADVALKSGTAKRTRSTPRLVPVRIQSCCVSTGTLTSASKRSIRAILFICPLCAARNPSALVIEVELHVHLATTIVRRQRPESVDPLQSPSRRDVQRRHAARLRYLYVVRPPVAQYLEGD